MSTDRNAAPVPDATTDRTPESAREAAAPDSRRRAALARLGRVAAYGVPVTAGLMLLPRSARAS